MDGRFPKFPPYSDQPKIRSNFQTIQSNYFPILRFHSKRRRLARRANPTSVSYFPPSRFPSLPFRLRGDPLYKRSICGATRTTNIMPHSSVDPLKDDRRQCLIRGSEAAILHLFQLYGDGAPSTDDQSAQFPALPLVCLSTQSCRCACHRHQAFTVRSSPFWASG